MMFGLKRKPATPEQTWSESVDQVLANCQNEVNGMSAAMAFRLRKHPIRAAAFATQAAPLLAEFKAAKKRLASSADCLRFVSDEELEASDELFGILQQSADDMVLYLDHKDDYLALAQRSF